MSKIRVAQITAPSNAPSSKFDIYLDSADGLLKYIDSSGAIKIISSFLSAARAFRNTSTQAISSTTATKVQLNGETYDPLGEFDSATNYRFTASKAGKYVVTGQVTLQAIASAKRMDVNLRVNGTDVTKMVNYYTNSNGNDQLLAVSDILNLAANDYVELWVFHTDTGNKNVLNGTEYTFMSIHRVA